MAATTTFGPLTRDASMGFIPASMHAQLGRREKSGLARFMDGSFVVPGTNIRFGIDGVIGDRFHGPPSPLKH